MAMSAIDFSIILPVFNDLKLMQGSLASIMCQKDVDMEIIIVDDSNKSADIEQYVLGLNSPIIKYVHNVPALGAVKNWNYGLSLCSGKYITLVHHDESFGSNDYLANMKRRLADSDVVVSDVEVHTGDGRAYRLASARSKRLFTKHPMLLFLSNMIGPTATLTFRNDVRLYFDEQLHWFVDVEWYYRLLNGRRVVYAPDLCVVSHHGHSGQITLNIDAMSVAKADYKLMKANSSLLRLPLLLIWVNINLIHNEMINKLIKKLLSR